MFTIINAPSLESADIPEHPTGGDWNHVLTLTNGQIAFTETATEAVGAILGSEYQALGDSDQDNDEALGMRVDLAHAFAAIVQTAVNQNAVQSGVLDMDTADEYTLTALHQAKSRPWIDATAPGGFGGGPHWDNPVPLVLVTTTYAPITKAEKPTGNVMWIDPILETDFITSLHQVGLIEYMRRVD